MLRDHHDIIKLKFLLFLDHSCIFITIRDHLLSIPVLKMSDKSQEEELTNAINQLTEKVSKLLLEEFLKLPKEMQLNIVMIKSAQLLLANILCHVATDREELQKIVDEQGVEISELSFNCAYTGFAHKFDLLKH